MDFKDTKKYDEAMQARDWQTCDLVADEHKELMGKIKDLEADLKFALSWACVLHNDESEAKQKLDDLFAKYSKEG